MKLPILSSRRLRALSLCFGAVTLALPYLSHAAPAKPLVDDFSDPAHTVGGSPRIVVTDKSVGGQSTANQQFDSGILKMTGHLAPARGQPAFVSLVSVLSPDGLPQDVSAYEGVSLRVKVKKGTLSLQVSTTDVDNYDYHMSAPLTRNPEQFQDIRIPFNSLRRAWSEQTVINLKHVTSINLVSFGAAADDFEYEVDEVRFY